MEIVMGQPLFRRGKRRLVDDDIGIAGEFNRRFAKRVSPNTATILPFCGGPTNSRPSMTVPSSSTTVFPCLIS